MKHPLPPRPELGTHDGLAYALFIPQEPPRAGALEGFRADREQLERWLDSVSLSDAAASLGPATALLLMHARGDEQVPYTVSEELYAVAAEPKRLLVMPGGHHRSLQHDVELQNESLRFVERALSR